MDLRVHQSRVDLILRSGGDFDRGDVGAASSEFKAQRPDTLDRVTIGLGGLEFPMPHGFKRPVSEILARAAGIEFGVGNGSGGVYGDTEFDAEFSVDGAHCTRRYVRHDGLRDFAFG